MRALLDPRTRLVLATELRTLLRDRRAFLFAVVLPMLLFPLLFVGMDKLEESATANVAGRRLPVHHDLTALAPEVASATSTSDRSTNWSRASSRSHPAIRGLGRGSPGWIGPTADRGARSRQSRTGSAAGTNPSNT